MRDEMVYSLKKLNKAFYRLKEASESAVDELDQDGVIQRFEFTFELFWKAVKIILENEGFRCAGPRSCLKEGARRGILSDGEMLLDMLEDRNKASHIYDEMTASEIFERIKKIYLVSMRKNLTLLEQYIDLEKE